MDDLLTRPASTGALALAHLVLVAAAFWRTRRPLLTGFHVFLGLEALAYGFRPLLNILTGGYLLYGFPADLVPGGAPVSFLPPAPVEPAAWAAYNRGLAMQLAFAATVVTAYGLATWTFHRGAGRAGGAGGWGGGSGSGGWGRSSGSGRCHGARGCGGSPDAPHPGRLASHWHTAWLLSLLAGTAAVVVMHVLSGGAWLPGHRGGTTITAAVPYGKILFPLAVIPLAASLPLARAAAAARAAAPPTGGRRSAMAGPARAMAAGAPSPGGAGPGPEGATGDAPPAQGGPGGPGERGGRRGRKGRKGRKGREGREGRGGREGPGGRFDPRLARGFPWDMAALAAGSLWAVALLLLLYQRGYLLTALVTTAFVDERLRPWTFRRLAVLVAGLLVVLAGARPLATAVAGVVEWGRPAAAVLARQNGTAADSRPGRALGPAPGAAAGTAVGTAAVEGRAATPDTPVPACARPWAAPPALASPPPAASNAGKPPARPDASPPRTDFPSSPYAASPAAVAATHPAAVSGPRAAPGYGVGAGHLAGFATLPQPLETLQQPLDEPVVQALWQALLQPLMQPVLQPVLHPLRSTLHFFARTPSFDGPDVWVLAQGFSTRHGDLGGRTLAAIPARILTPAARGERCLLTAADVLNTYRWRQFYWQTRFGFNVSLAQEVYLNFGSEALPAAGALAGLLAAAGDRFVTLRHRRPFPHPALPSPFQIYAACAVLAAAAFTKEPAATLQWTAAYLLVGAAIEAGTWLVVGLGSRFFDGDPGHGGGTGRRLADAGPRLVVRPVTADPAGATATRRTGVPPTLFLRVDVRNVATGATAHRRTGARTGAPPTSLRPASTRTQAAQSAHPPVAPARMPAPEPARPLASPASCGPVRVVICRSNPVDPDPRVERVARTLARAGYEVTVAGWNRSVYGRGLRHLPAWLGWQVRLLGWLLRHRRQIDVVHACDFDTLLPALMVKAVDRLARCLLCPRIRRAPDRPSGRLPHRSPAHSAAPKAVIYDIFDWYADTVAGLPGPARRLLAALDRRLLTRADAVILADERRLPQLGAARPRRLAVIYNSPDWEGEYQEKREGKGQPGQQEQPEGKQQETTQTSGRASSHQAHQEQPEGMRQRTTPSLDRSSSHRAHQGKTPEGERPGESRYERPGPTPRYGKDQAPGPRDEAGAGCRDWTQGRAQRARPTPHRAAAGRPALRLAYVGTLQPGRGLQELLAVLARHPEWHLDLAGFGPDEPALRRAAEVLPNVRFHGRVSHAGCRALYARADVIPALYDPAIPNHRYASPSKVFEAMALGKPVIVARGTGIDRRVRRHRLGWVVPYGSVGSLEAALTEAAGWTPAQRRAFTRRARRLYRRRWGWPRMERRLLRLYREVVAAHEEEVPRQPEPFNPNAWGCTSGQDSTEPGGFEPANPWAYEPAEPGGYEPPGSVSRSNAGLGHPSVNVAPKQSARPKGTSNPPPDSPSPNSPPPVSRSPERRLPAPRTSAHIPRVLIGRHVSPAVRRHVLLWALGNGMAVDLIPDPYEVLLAGSRWGQLDDMPLLQVGPLAPPPAARLVKRILDVVGSLVLLVLFAWAFALIPLLIWLDDRGPVLYRQTRLGLHGRPFTILKFRTMVVDAERATGPVWARQDDPRVTRIGRLLRATHLDELPQLVNVLRGEMSLVGPRPERPELAARFSLDEPAFRLREAVKPGLTGLAQIRGRYHTEPGVKLAWDLRYARYAAGPMGDFRVLVASVFRPVLSDSNRFR